ncbi:MAG: UDP-N-acetylglucosamine--N-acetylmuramyl-(pentapeptide) pyrophosphoryl-undecaprenol N-acetylglucosamine transferase [Patescibacteria group bacterium]
MKQPIICITGGHLTPALAVIDEIKRQKLLWKLVFIGRSHAFEGGGSPAHEERLISAFGIPFHALFTGRQGPSMWKFPIGFFQSFFLLASYRPKAVLSFGGYIALPVAIAAWILRIPIITHEQTEDLGLANAIIARLARRVLLAREIGIPMRNALFHPPGQPLSFPIDSKLPLIYITGGSTGAQSLNAFVYPNVGELIGHNAVIHQVGTPGLGEALRVKEALTKTMRSRYIVVSYLDIGDLSWVYHNAVLLIGRAGANTVAEVSALGLPALFIPLPWAAGNEQSHNAARLEKSGTAVVVNQHALTPASFLTHVFELMQHLDTHRYAAKRVALAYPRSAASKIVDEVARCIHP